MDRCGEGQFFVAPGNEIGESGRIAMWQYRSESKGCMLLESIVGKGSM